VNSCPLLRAAAASAASGHFGGKGHEKSTLLSVLIATTTVAAADVAYAAVPPVDTAGKSALSACPTATTKRIFHFDKVVFQIATGNLVPVIAADAAALKALPRNTDLDIKIIDDPRTVSDLESKVLSFLGAQPANPGNRQLLRITEVEYSAIVCP
jgi:hypothetical protein